VTIDDIGGHTTQGTAGLEHRLDQNTQANENDEHIFLTPGSGSRRWPKHLHRRHFTTWINLDLFICDLDW